MEYPHEKYDCRRCFNERDVLEDGGFFYCFSQPKFEVEDHRTEEKQVHEPI